MENRINPEASVDPPRPTTYEEKLRAKRAAATQAKLEKPATPAPTVEEDEDDFYEDFSFLKDISLSKFFENLRSKWKNPFKKIHFTWPKPFKNFKFTWPRIFKKSKKEPEQKSETASKEETPMEKKTGKFHKVYTWFDRKLDAFCKSLLFGIIVAIILNVIAKYFWPELPTKIPTVYGFFNGFLTVTEFFYKTALGGIAAIFNGTFGEFSNGVGMEIKEMWNAFCTWMSSIHF